MPKLKVVVILLLLLGLVFLVKDKVFQKRFEITKSQIPSSEIYQGIGYVSVNNDLDISVLSDSVAAPTRLKITPDNKYLLVTQISGEVLAFKRIDKSWESSPSLVTKVDTKFPGFPPDEAGLVGITFSKDYLTNGKVFLLHSFKDKEGKTQNQISSSILKETKNGLTGSNPKVIYQANVAGNPSHQITDAINVDIEGKPHLLFLIGEGFDSKKSQDPSLEAGKLLLIQEDGSDPMGPRPYKENSKVQALGIRNGYVLVKNQSDPEGKIIITDTGPDHFDRMIYTNPLAANPLNFFWDGVEAKLKNPIPDPNFPKVSDMVIQRLPDTKTYVGADFNKSGSLLITLFGKTGFKDNTPGKEILKGNITNLTGQPKVSFQTIIKRNPEANGKLGNPIGLTIDKETDDFFFADVMEGKIYQVKQRGGERK